MPPGFFQIRVVLSGPSDVGNEKETVKYLCNEINQDLRDECKVNLLPLDYNESVVPQLGPRIQDLVDESIGEYEVYIGILRTRFGSPPGGHHPETGAEYCSGTEREFEDAYSRWKLSNEPIINFYFAKDPRLNAPPTAKEIDQLSKVIRFKDKIKDEYLGWIVEYDNSLEFERKVRRFLNKVCRDINKRAMAAPLLNEISVVHKMAYQEVAGYLQRAVAPVEQTASIGSSYHW